MKELLKFEYRVFEYFFSGTQHECFDVFRQEAPSPDLLKNCIDSYCLFYKLYMDMFCCALHCVVEGHVLGNISVLITYYNVDSFTLDVGTQWC